MRGPAFAQGGHNPMEGMGVGLLLCLACCLCIFVTIVIACESERPNRFCLQRLLPDER